MTKYDIQWFFHVLFSPVRGLWEVGRHVRVCWKMRRAGRRILCGMEAAKFLGLKADDALLLMDDLESEGTLDVPVGAGTADLSNRIAAADSREEKVQWLVKAHRYAEVVELLKDVKLLMFDEGAALAVARIATGDFAGAAAALNEVLPFKNAGVSTAMKIRMRTLRDAARILEDMTTHVVDPEFEKLTDGEAGAGIFSSALDYVRKQKLVSPRKMAKELRLSMDSENCLLRKFVQMELVGEYDKRRGGHWKLRGVATGGTPVALVRDRG